MDDIKRVKKQIDPKKTTNLNDLVWLKQSDKSSAQEISRPTGIIKPLMAKLGIFFALGYRVKIVKYFAAIILLLTILLLGIFLGTKLNSNPETVSVDISPSIKGSFSSKDFITNAYYKIELVDGATYYGNLSKAELDHYELTNVFYNIVDEGLDGENKITLAKLTNDQDQPQDELIIPREKVKTISQLVKNSPIIKAINSYLKTDE